MAAQTYDYIVTLKPSRNFGAINIVSQLLLVLGVIIHARQIAVAPDTTYQVLSAVSIGMIIFFWWRNRDQQRFSFPLLFIAISTLILKDPWLFALFFVSGILEHQLKFPEEIGFNESSLVFNSFPKKRYDWSGVNNVIMKDNIITIDLKDNKVIQREIQSDIPDSLEKEFNQFCRDYLQLHNRSVA